MRRRTVLSLFAQLPPRYRPCLRFPPTLISNSLQDNVVDVYGMRVGSRVIELPHLDGAGGGVFRHPLHPYSVTAKRLVRADICQYIVDVESCHAQRVVVIPDRGGTLRVGVLEFGAAWCPGSTIAGRGLVLEMVVFGKPAGKICCPNCRIEIS